MGLHRFSKTPCGFCFVEYVTREGAEMAMRYVNRTRLDDRLVRTDWDAGYEEGRQYGRGRSGGQVVGYNRLARSDIPSVQEFNNWSDVSDKILSE
ncbi:hypothetical protein AHF37_06141 [Paragonimus kellicotti]|nr:hypothetical protein AHF37_06141 [Paragonimus kellicotti]